MRILIIGHSVKDIIHNGEKETVSPGGIYYSVLGCLACTGMVDKLQLLTAVDKQNEALFSDIYSQLNGNSIIMVDKIPVVHLRLFEDSERCEYYENITQKLSMEIISQFNDFDGILINMITGFDLTLKDLLKIRSEYKGLIYLDIHTLSRGLDQNNQRNFRVVPDASRWISSVDFLQVNEHELFTLYPGSNQSDIIKTALKTGLKYLILTKGAQGVRIFWLKNEELNSLFYPALKVDTRNTVGCGDIFGSVFFCNYIKTHDINNSLKVGNIATGCAAGYSNINEFIKLKNDTLSRFN